MAVSVLCPNCGSSYRVAPESLGHSARCKVCEKLFALESNAGGTRGSQGAVETFQPANTAGPQKLGRFEIRSRLGAGAFGAVYRAYDPLLEREVALKVPHPAAFATEADKARFLREPKAAAQLRHPNIVPIHDAGMDQEQFFIASAFIEGQTLQAKVEDQRPDFRATAKLVMNLAEALDYAHGQGIVHRDVKPANIMLDGQGVPLLMDFGLARLREAEDKLTHDGAVLGTPAYMSPEQAGGQSENIGPASDQYSLGVVLYELLCGERPFSGPPSLVISLVQHQEPPSPRRSNPQIPKDLETVCLKAMSLEPSRRYKDCREMSDDLRRWLEGEPIQARRQGPLERTVRWCRRNPVTAGSLGLVLLVFVAATAVSMRFAVQARGEKRAAYRRLYASNMLLAQQAWEDARIDRLQQLLDEARPEKTDGLDLRGFEWHFWQRQSHAELLTLGNPGACFYATFSPDGKKLASAHGGTVKVWDTANGKELLSLAGHTPIATCVAFSPDGERLACGTGSSSESGTRGIVKVWEMSSGREIQSFQEHTSTIRQLSYGVEGGRILSRSAGGFDHASRTYIPPQVKIWEAATGKVIYSFEQESPSGRRSDIFCAALDQNGEHLLSVGRDELDGTPMFKVWDLTSGQETTTTPISTREANPAMTFSPDGKQLASAGHTYGVQLWELPTGRQIMAFPGHFEQVNSLVFSCDGKHLASGSSDRTVRVWDLESKVLGRNSPRGVSFRGHTQRVNYVGFSPDGQRLASCGWDSLKIWNATSDPEGRSLNGVGVAFSPGGRRLATPFKNSVIIWDAGTGGKLRTFLGFQNLKHWNNFTVGSVAFSPDGKRLATGGGGFPSPGSSGLVQVWDAATGRELFSLDGHTGIVWSVAFSPDGKRLASASGWANPLGGSFSSEGSLTSGAPNDKGDVKIWDLETQKELVSVRDHPYGAFQVAFSPDGRKLASVGYTGVSIGRKAIISDSKTGRQMLSINSKLELCCATFSPDGNYLTCGSKDRAVIEFHAGTGKPERVLRGHGGGVFGVAYHPDGQRLASIDVSETVKIWDTVSGQELLTLQGSSSDSIYQSDGLNVAFSPDGRQLAATGRGATVRIWDAAPMRSGLDR